MSSENLKSLSSHCIGTAESEEGFLSDVYISHEPFLGIWESPCGAPIVLIGKKGSGKSALLKELTHLSNSSGISSLYLKPDDLATFESVSHQTDIATLKKKAYNSLIGAITVKVGMSIRMLLSRDDKKLIDEAIKGGARSENIVLAGIRVLSNLGTELTKINFSAFIPKIGSSNKEELERVLKRNFERQRKVFMLCIDDTDQVASTAENHVNRIWAFLLAIKKISEELPNIKCVVSLRSEVWNLIKRDSSGQRDQVDHFLPLLRFLDPTDSEIKSIITKRLEYVNSTLGLPQRSGNPFETFFSGTNVELPTSSETRSWVDFLVKQSRERPRDSLQLINFLAQASIKNGKSRIDSADVEAAVPLYSKGRVEDLCTEFQSDCSVLSSIIDSFSALDFRIDVERIHSHFNSLPSQFSILIRGRTCHHGIESDIFYMWNFIHETGFLNPFVTDSRQKKNFRHLSYSTDPNFVSQSNWNNMQKAMWEIHPSYRSHLMILKANERARTGSLRPFYKR